METNENTTPRPWTVAYGAIYAGESCLLLADRNNPKTNPVERDGNLALACRAANAHDELVAALEGLLSEFWTDRKRGNVRKDYRKLLVEEAAKRALAKAKSP